MEQREEDSNTSKPVEQTAKNQKLYRKRHRSAKWDEIMYKLDLERSSVSYSTIQSSANNNNSNDGGQPVVKHWKDIGLSGSTISDIEDFPDFPHAFSIKPKSSSRTYYFASTDAESKLLVLNELCQLQFAEKRPSDNSSACLLQ